MTNLTAHADAKYTKAHSGALITYGECRWLAGDNAGTKRAAKRRLIKARRAAEKRLVRGALAPEAPLSGHELACFWNRDLWI